MEDNVFSPSKEGIKSVANFASKVVSEKGELPSYETINFNETGFKACSNTLPEKTGFWTKVKNVLFYEIKVELTPYQQKVEDEINDFLHQEITFKGVKNFLFQEVTFGKKNK